MDGGVGPAPAATGGHGDQPCGPDSASQLLSQRRLDELVTQTAVRLMSVSASTLQAALELTLQTLGEFFGVDTCFLRRNDHQLAASVLVAEWPKRPVIPDPDPLGIVPFDADPAFAASRNLTQPLVIRPEASPDAYQERVQQASGINQVSLATVPLVHEDTTKGIIGFINFGDRPWSKAELNALQAVASLIVQLQARIAAEERLKHRAYHDELTGLPNRRALLEQLHSNLGNGADDPTALVFFDLDRFKVMNDFLGHSAGDRLLVAIADRLRSCLRPGDFIARLGGDEFVMLLSHPIDEAVAVTLARTALERIAQPIAVGGVDISRSGSAGIALGIPRRTTGDELLGRADVALYAAKSRGGNRVTVFDDEMRAAVEERSETELALRGAIEDGSLRLFFQPEFNLRTGELLAVEALVRWQHPTRGLLPAGAFVPVAEETGMIVELGQWVLDRACAQRALWAQEYPGLDMAIRVNVSAAQVASQHIVTVVAEALATHGVDPHSVCLEITESAFIHDTDRAVRTLNELVDLGVTLAIDDFGTGFSSMAQLKRLPVRVLKLDRSFVTGLGTDAGDTAIVESIIKLAEAFGLDLVAEGVEEAPLVAELLERGCYRAQGFLMCRPKPAEELVDIIRNRGIDPAVLTGLPVPDRLPRALAPLGVC